MTPQPDWWVRYIRTSAALDYRESDRRDPAEVRTWTRARDAQRRRQAVKDTMRNMEGQ